MERNIQIVGKLASEFDRFWLPEDSSYAKDFEALEAQIGIVLGGGYARRFKVLYHFAEGIYQALLGQPRPTRDDWLARWGGPTDQIAWFDRPSYLLDRTTNCLLIKLITNNLEKFRGQSHGPLTRRKLIRRNTNTVARLVRRELNIHNITNGPLYQYGRMVTNYWAKK
jgi:hypothetical protein